MGLGRKHVLYDLWVDDASLLKQVDAWREILLAAAKGSGATIIDYQFHQFSPHGVTGFLLLAESHISVHTWPEEGLAALDIFTCGPMDTNFIIARLRERFKPCRERLTTVNRGIFDGFDNKR